MYLILTKPVSPLIGLHLLLEQGVLNLRKYSYNYEIKPCKIINTIV